MVAVIGGRFLRQSGDGSKSPGWIEVKGEEARLKVASSLQYQQRIKGGTSTSKSAASAKGYSSDGSGGHGSITCTVLSKAVPTLKRRSLPPSPTKNVEWEQNDDALSVSLLLEHSIRQNNSVTSHVPLQMAVRKSKSDSDVPATTILSSAMHVPPAMPWNTHPALSESIGTSTGRISLEATRWALHAHPMNLFHTYQPAGAVGAAHQLFGDNPSTGSTFLRGTASPPQYSHDVGLELLPDMGPPTHLPVLSHLRAPVPPPLCYSNVSSDANAELVLPETPSPSMAISQISSLLDKAVTSQYVAPDNHCELQAQCSSITLNHEADTPAQNDNATSVDRDTVLPNMSTSPCDHDLLRMSLESIRCEESVGENDECDTVGSDIFYRDDNLFLEPLDDDPESTMGHDNGNVMVLGSTSTVEYTLSPDGQDDGETPADYTDLPDFAVGPLGIGPSDLELSNMNEAMQSLMEPWVEPQELE